MTAVVHNLQRINKMQNKITLGKQMSNNYVSCFNRIDFIFILSYIEVPCSRGYSNVLVPL